MKNPLSNQPIIQNVIVGVGAAIGAKLGLSEAEIDSWVQTTAAVALPAIGGLTAWFKAWGPESVERKVDEAKRETRRDGMFVAADADADSAGAVATVDTGGLL